MLLHIGADASVPLDKLLFVLNERGMTPETRSYIDRARAEHRYTPCTGKPKSYVVAKERGREAVYESILAASTLEKRLRDEQTHAYLEEAAVVTAFFEEP